MDSRRSSIVVDPRRFHPVIRIRLTSPSPSIPMESHRSVRVCPSSTRRRSPSRRCIPRDRPIRIIYSRVNYNRLDRAIRRLEMTSTSKSIDCSRAFFSPRLFVRLRTRPFSSPPTTWLPPRTREQIEARTCRVETRSWAQEKKKKEKKERKQRKREREGRKDEMEQREGISRRWGEEGSSRTITGDLRMQAISWRLRNYWNTSCP